MIAAEQSTWIAYLQNETGQDIDPLNQALSQEQLLIVPAVLTELISDPGLTSSQAAILAELPMIETTVCYWRRAGELRSKVIARGRKAKLGDALIAQSCIDREIPLIARDRDYRFCAEAAKLKLILG